MPLVPGTHQQADVVAMVERRVASEINRDILAQAVILPNTQDWTSRVGPGMDRLVVPELDDDFEVETPADDGVCLQVQKMTFSNCELLLCDEEGISFDVTDKASIQAKADFVRVGIERATQRLILSMDSQLLDEIDANVAVANQLTAVTPGCPALEDVTAARAALCKKNLPWNEMIIGLGCDGFKKLLDNNNISDASQFGTPAVQTGVVGSLYGARVVEHPLFDAKDAMYVWHPTAAAWARQKQPQLETDRNPKCRLTEYTLSHMWGKKSLYDGCRVVKVDLATP